MSSAAEARFRIPAPPPTARAVAVAALDAPSSRVVSALAARAWQGVSFFPAHGGADRADAPIADVVDADLVVMVATAGAGAHAVAPIGRACSDRRVPTATFVLRGSATDEALSATLAQVRPWSLMLVVAGDESYVADILTSLR